MASGFSTYLRNKLLDHAVGKTSYTMPTVWLALSSTQPVADGTGVTEPTAMGYVRLAMTAANWAAASAGANTTAQELTFTEATGSWGEMAFWATYDNATTGNMLTFGTITVPKTYSSGDTPKVAIGDLDLTINNT